MTATTVTHTANVLDGADQLEHKNTCRLCGGSITALFSKTVLGKYAVTYFRCSGCLSLLTERPYWLDEAYRESNLSNADTGAAQRNLRNLAATYGISKLLKAKNVIDIGGGSLEIAVGIDESPEVATSLPLGASRLTQKFLTGNPYSQKGITAMRDHIESQLEAVLPALVKHQDSDRSIATSKTLRTLARLSGDWFDTNGNNIKFDVIRKIATRLADMTHEERTKLPGVSSNRAKQIVAGAFVTESVMRNLDLRELEICPWALREGIVLKYMDWMEKG